MTRSPLHQPERALGWHRFETGGRVRLKACAARSPLVGIVLIGIAVVLWAGESAPLRAQGKPDGTGNATKLPLAAALKGKNLIVITLDTTRADHVSCYGHPDAKGLTPHIDKLAADGVLFLNAYSQTNVTNPSHTSIFTGLYAIDAKIMNNQTSITLFNPEMDTLPAAFQRAKYRTAGFPATPHLSDLTLKLPGFDETNTLMGSPKADEMVDKALKWIDRPSDKPFFMWLHFFDPHMRYEAPVEFSRPFYSGNPCQGDAPPLEQDEFFMRSPDIVKGQFSKVRDRAYPPAMYKGEMKFTDAQIGRFVAGLKQRGLYDSTGIVLVADHGESLGEHKIYYDHFGMYETSLRVPLLAYLPGLPSGVRVTQTVTHIDIVPTICHLYGVAVKQPEGMPMHGINLVDAMLQRPDPAVGRRHSLVHEDAHNRQVLARRGPWKLIYQIRDPVYPEHETMLFNLDDDPEEKNSLAAKRPDIVSELQPMIQRWIDRGSWGIKNKIVQGGKLTPEQQKEWERLKALGYVDEDEDEAKSQHVAAHPGKDPGAKLSMGEFGAAAESPEVGLTPEQKRQISAVFSKARRESRAAQRAGDKERVSKIRQKLRDDIRGLLDDKQRTALEEAVKKRVAKKERDGA